MPTRTRPDLDPVSCYRAVTSRDRRFDGVFYTAVRTTGIYCRPSCPARTPAPANVTFHPSAASAQQAGYRACKRCLPDATPGSPDWDATADVAGRAMRLIADGVVDRDGVDGLAARVGYTPRHLGRILTAEVGAGPLALARARRAQTARVLVESTDLPLTDVAFAAGFSSIRQFNQTVREVYGETPGALRGRRSGAAPAGGGRGPAGDRPGASGTLRLRLAVRTPFAGRALLRFLAHHVVPGVETAGPGWYARTVDLPHAPGVLRLDLDDLGLGEQPGTATVPLTVHLEDLRDTAAVVERARRLVDADCDPVAVDGALMLDPLLAPLVRSTPGLRLPGGVDGDEVAVRTVVGQQVSVAGARTVTGRIVAEHGVAVQTPVDGLDRLFPAASRLAVVEPTTLPMPRARGRALVGLAAALADGHVVLHRGIDRDAAREAMLALSGIGPWTADYTVMRALAHPDVFLPTDLGVRNAAVGLGRDPTEVADRVDGWRPWRSYALMHLWNTLIPGTTKEPHPCGP